ncbi:MAG: thiamine-phosphate kinase [Gemmatimonadota bacterium]
MSDGGRGATPLGGGKEFDRIREILSGLPSLGPGIRVGPGDDACVLEDGWVISTDLSVEGIHFRLDWITAEEAGFRAAAGGLSDLAAMAADPIGILASVAAPEAGEGAIALMAGVKRLAQEHGAPLLGGDLTRSPGPLFLDIVSVGRAETPLLRSGAEEGDELWVTGSLGGAAGATALWSAGLPVPPPLRQAFAQPRPRILEARWLVQAGARGGLDLSDGLAGDGGHLAAASGVAVVLEEEAIPIHPALAAAALPGSAGPLALALHGGEDYELLLAAPSGRLAPRVEEFARRFDLSLTRVGRVVRGEGVYLEPAGSGPLRRPDRGGYDHFGGGGGT